MFSIFVAALALGGPKPSCCQVMANMTLDPAFRALHEAPVAFNFVPEYGHMGKVAGADAYIVPASPHSHGGVVMIHEWWGLSNQIKATAEKLHEATGDGVVAVDLYGGKVATTADAAAAAMRAVNEEAATAQLKATIDAILHEHVLGESVRKVGTVGYCFGGGYSLKAALAGGSDVSACVMYYGYPELSPQKLEALHAPVLGNFANKDGFITPSVVDQFVTAMHAAGKPLTVYRYDADHAFANPSNPHYDQKATALAWRRTVAFFKKHLD